MPFKLMCQTLFYLPLCCLIFITTQCDKCFIMSTDEEIGTQKSYQNS